MTTDALSRRPCPHECSHCRKVQQRADGPRERIVATAAANGCDRQALGREQSVDDVVPLMWKMEAEQRPE